MIRRVRGRVARVGSVLDAEDRRLIAQLWVLVFGFGGAAVAGATAIGFAWHALHWAAGA